MLNVGVNTTDPSDITPLSYGPGLVLGLLLILGLPTERRAPRPVAPPPAQVNSPPERTAPGSDRLRWEQQAVRERRVPTASSRP